VRSAADRRANNNTLLIIRNACIMPSDCRKRPTPMAEAGAGANTKATEKEPRPSERNDMSAARIAGRPKGGKLRGDGKKFGFARNPLISPESRKENSWNSFTFPWSGFPFDLVWLPFRLEKFPLTGKVLYDLVKRLDPAIAALPAAVCGAFLVSCALALRPPRRLNGP